MLDTYSEILRRDEMRCRRNDDLLRCLDQIEGRSAVVASKTDRMKSLRAHYESLLDRSYPQVKLEDYRTLPLEPLKTMTITDTSTQPFASYSFVRRSQLPTPETIEKLAIAKSQKRNKKIDIDFDIPKVITTSVRLSNAQPVITNTIYTKSLQKSPTTLSLKLKDIIVKSETNDLKTLLKLYKDSEQLKRQSENDLSKSQRNYKLYNTPIYSSSDVGRVSPPNHWNFGSFPNLQSNDQRKPELRQIENRGLFDNKDFVLRPRTRSNSTNRAVQVEEEDIAPYYLKPTVRRSKSLTRFPTYSANLPLTNCTTKYLTNPSPTFNEPIETDTDVFDSFFSDSFDTPFSYSTLPRTYSRTPSYRDSLIKPRYENDYTGSFYDSPRPFIRTPSLRMSRPQERAYINNEYEKTYRKVPLRRTGSYKYQNEYLPPQNHFYINRNLETPTYHQHYDVGYEEPFQTEYDYRKELNPLRGLKLNDYRRYDYDALYSSPREPYNETLSRSQSVYTPRSRTHQSSFPRSQSAYSKYQRNVELNESPKREIHKSYLKSERDNYILSTPATNATYKDSYRDFNDDAFPTKELNKPTSILKDKKTNKAPLLSTDEIFYKNKNESPTKLSKQSEPKSNNDKLPSDDLRDLIHKHRGETSYPNPTEVEPKRETIPVDDKKDINIKSDDKKVTFQDDKENDYHNNEVDESDDVLTKYLGETGKSLTDLGKQFNEEKQKTLSSRQSSFDEKSDIAKNGKVNLEKNDSSKFETYRDPTKLGDINSEQTKQHYDPLKPYESTYKHTSPINKENNDIIETIEKIEEQESLQVQDTSQPNQQYEYHSTGPNQQYDPHIQYNYDPSQEYNQEHYNSNQGYEPSTLYDSNQAYEQTDPNQGYDQTHTTQETESIDPNQVYGDSSHPYDQTDPYLQQGYTEVDPNLQYKYEPSQQYDNQLTYEQPYDNSAYNVTSNYDQVSQEYDPNEKLEKSLPEKSEIVPSLNENIPKDQEQNVDKKLNTIVKQEMPIETKETIEDTKNEVNEGKQNKQEEVLKSPEPVIEEKEAKKEEPTLLEQKKDTNGNKEDTTTKNNTKEDKSKEVVTPEKPKTFKEKQEAKTKLSEKQKLINQKILKKVRDTKNTRKNSEDGKGKEKEKTTIKDKDKGMKEKESKNENVKSPEKEKVVEGNLKSEPSSTMIDNTVDTDKKDIFDKVESKQNVPVSEPSQKEITPDQALVESNNQNYKEIDQYVSEQPAEQEYDPNVQYNQFDPNMPYDPNQQFNTDPNQQYDPNQQFDPSQQYDPNIHYDPNQQYDMSQYHEGQEYDPNVHYDPNDPNIQYDPNDPNQQYDPNAQYEYDPNDLNQQYDPNAVYAQYDSNQPTEQFDPNQPTGEYDPNVVYEQQQQQSPTPQQQPPQ